MFSSYNIIRDLYIHPNLTVTQKVTVRSYFAVTWISCQIQYQNKQILRQNQTQVNPLPAVHAQSSHWCQDVLTYKEQMFYPSLITTSLAS